jgi:hypothetical protein
LLIKLKEYEEISAEIESPSSEVFEVSPLVTIKLWLALFAKKVYFNVG